MNKRILYISILLVLCATSVMEARVGRFFASKSACAVYGMLAGMGSSVWVMGKYCVKPLVQEKNSLIEQLKTETRRTSFLEQKLQKSRKEEEKKTSFWGRLFGCLKSSPRIVRLANKKRLYRCSKLNETKHAEQSNDTMLSGLVIGHNASQEEALKAMHKCNAAHKVALEAARRELKIVRREKWVLEAENVDLRFDLHQLAHNWKCSIRTDQKFIKGFRESLDRLSGGENHE